MTLLTTTDGIEIAQTYRDLALMVERETRSGGLISRANDWDGNLRGSPTDGKVRGGPTPDPTGALGKGEDTWTTTIGKRIADEARAIERRLLVLRGMIKECDTPIPPEKGKTALQQRDELADQNIGRGQCQICGDSCSGTGSDRRSTMTVKANVIHHGIAVREETNVRLACNPCREAWRRHTAGNGSADFRDWETLRKAGKQREAV